MCPLQHPALHLHRILQGHIYGGFSVEHHHCASLGLLGGAAAQITMAITGKRDLIPAFLLLGTI